MRLENSTVKNEVQQDVSFPYAGIDTSAGFGRIRGREVADGIYGSSTPIGVNVRGYDPSNDRLRGASRAGYTRYINAQVGGSSGLIQSLSTIVGVGYSAPGGGTQTSPSGRVVTLVAVKDGLAYVADAGATSWVAATNGSTATTYFSTTAVVRTAPLGQRLYMVDGANARKYNPATNTIEDWETTEGTFPVDTANNKPRLIALWRGRIVVSGLPLDAQNWFMSRTGDPTDWDYAPTDATATDAVAGNNESLGKVGDVVTGIIPYSDDLLIFLCDSSIWMLAGDPLSGGQLGLLSDATGGAFGNAWAKDPSGNVYFFGSRGMVYSLRPGSQPIPIAQAIAAELAAVNTGTNTITMAWDTRFQTLHVYITPTAAAGSATHYCYEARTGAWWRDTFSSNNHNPLAVTVFDGNLPSDRVPLIGSWDGYVRAVDADAETDDGQAIQSEVWLGPLVSQSFDELMVKEFQAEMGHESGSATFSWHSGRTAEAALLSDPWTTGTLTSGRNYARSTRRAAYAHYLKVNSSSRWSMEKMRVVLVQSGVIRRRGR